MRDFRVRRQRCLMVGGLFCAAAGTPAYAQTDVRTVIAAPGDPAPGLPAGFRFWGVPTQPAIGGDGSIVFADIACVDPPDTPPCFSTAITGIWSGLPGSIQLVTKTENPQNPSLPSEYKCFNLNPHVDASGRVALWCKRVFQGRERLLFASPPSAGPPLPYSIETVIDEGQPLVCPPPPGTAYVGHGDANCDGAPTIETRVPQLSRAGTMADTVTVQDPGDPPSPRACISVGDVNDVCEVACLGEPAPGTGGFAYFYFPPASYWPEQVVQITESGFVAFWAAIGLPQESITGLFAGSRDSIGVVARTLLPDEPGLPPGDVYTEFSSYSVANQTLVYTASTAQGRQGLWRFRNGASEMVLMSGQVLSAPFPATVELVGRGLLNQRNDIFASVYISTPGSAWRSALCFIPAGATPEIIAWEGQFVPGLGTLLRWDGGSMPAPTMNRDSLVVIGADFQGPDPGSPTVHAICAWHPRMPLRSILRGGDSVSHPGGGSLTISNSYWVNFNPLFAFGGGGDDGLRNVIDDDGVVVLRQYFDNPDAALGYSPCIVAIQVYIPPAFRPGDVNCDGVVSVGDIGGFVMALTDPVGYAATYPTCDIRNADINGDGVVSVGDIGPFVLLLTGG